MSHKLLRLAVPFALAGALVSSRSPENHSTGPPSSCSSRSMD